MNPIDAAKLKQFQQVRKPVEPRGKDTEYGQMMLDLCALLDAKELRCNDSDEDGKYLMVWHQDGLWPIPFARLEKLRELKLIRFTEIENNTAVDLSLVLPRDKTLYWVKQWQERGRTYTPPPDKEQI